MNRYSRISAFLTVVLMLAATGNYALGQSSAARGKVLAPAPVFPVQHAPASAPKRTLVETYLVEGNGFSTAIPAATFTPIDAPLTVNCPGPKKCTLLTNQWVATNGSAASNNFAICFYVDGAVIPNGCYYTNDTPSDGTFDQGGTSSWDIGVIPGHHTVETFVYSNAGCNYQEYQFQYLVYKP